jgi:hypothetical protein
MCDVAAYWFCACHVLAAVSAWLPCDMFLLHVTVTQCIAQACGHCSASTRVLCDLSISWHDQGRDHCVDVHVLSGLHVFAAKAAAMALSWPHNPADTNFQDQLVHVTVTHHCLQPTKTTNITVAKAWHPRPGTVSVPHSLSQPQTHSLLHTHIHNMECAGHKPMYTAPVALSLPQSQPPNSAVQLTCHSPAAQT